MITSLSIRNFALIDKLNIDFKSGFSVVTGETGAGKSIILGALSLILGSRAEVKAIKNKEQKCVIEGVFDLSSYDLKSFFFDADIEYDEAHCILRRELQPSGKSRAFINDTPVSLNQLKTLGTSLIDIHSQHQNLLLGDDKYQLMVIDTLAENKHILEDYSKVYAQFKQLQTELRIVQDRISKGREEADYLRFQYDQLEEAKLENGEQGALEAELETLANVEDIKQAIFATTSLLDSDEGGIISALRDASNRMNSITSVYAPSQEIAERLYSNYVDLKELYQEIDSLQDNIVYDPERHTFIQERLDLLYKLGQKHHVNTDAELIVIRDEMGERLAQIDNSDETVSELEAKIAEVRAQMGELASALSSRRKATSKVFSEALVEKLKPLGMPNVRFDVAFSTKHQFDDQGFDNLQFMFSANKNQQLMPVIDIASGGEISRLMLVIKSIIANTTSLPTIIFDEIDTGVSGEIADKMGQIMQDMSAYMQVLTISHLPQVASKGDEHYKVYKMDTDDSTVTNIILLSEKERVEEIARMLSGAVMTEQAKENARALIEASKIRK